MTVTYRNGISILELLIYGPGLPLANFIAYRHGFQWTGGWLFLIFFSIMRIVGASSQLALMGGFNLRVEETYVVCSQVAPSFLISASIGLTGRANQKTRTPLSSLLFRGVGLINLSGVVLGIVGGAIQSSSSSITTVQPETKAGVLIFLASRAGTCALLILTLLNTFRHGLGERKLLYAVAFAAPFILVRLVYSILGSFRGRRWSIATGSVTVFLVMAVLEEIIVIVVLLGTGLALMRKDNNSTQDDGSNRDVGLANLRA
ncbi:MAG: hypothetical protein Q9191_006482 [Dirinaria sp. TL-2023a]